MIQQKGLYLISAMLLSSVWLLRARALKPAIILAGTYGVLVLLPFGVFAALHALPDYLYANYVWPLTNYSDLNACPYGFPIWRNLAVTLGNDSANPVAWMADLASSTPFFVIAALPFLLPFVAWRRVELPYWLAGYALWFAELHRLDMGHLRNGVVLLAVVFFAQCETGRSVFFATCRLGRDAVCGAGGNGELGQ